MNHLTLLVFAIWSTSVYALPATSSTDDLPPLASHYSGYSSIFSATGSVKPETCHPTAITKGKSTVLTSTCSDPCNGRPSPPPIPPELQPDVNGQFKDGSWACMMDRSQKVWPGNEAQLQCINTCKEKSAPGHFNGTNRAIVCFGRFFPEGGPNQFQPLLNQCPLDNFQLGKCKCDTAEVEFVINEAVTVILPKFGQAVEEVAVLVCEAFAKPFVALVQSIVEIPKDIMSMGPDLLSFLDGVANLTAIDDAEALYDHFKQWLDPCRHVEGADQMSGILDKIDEAFDDFWAAVLTLVDGVGWLKIAKKWEDWLKLAKGDRPDYWPRPNKPTDKGPEPTPSKLPSDSKKPSTPASTPASTPPPTTKPTPGPTPTTGKAPSTKSSATSDHSTTSSTPAACLVKRDGAAANAWKPGVLTYTNGDPACDDHVTVTEITSIEFNKKTLSVSAAKCSATWTQACHHYSSVIRGDKSFETLPCPNRAGREKTSDLARHATVHFDRDHGHDWIQNKYFLHYDPALANSSPFYGPDVANTCQKDEYPPLYLLEQGDPTWENYKQKVRLLPNSENQGASSMWGSMCWEEGIQTDKKGIAKFGNDPNPTVRKDDRPPDANGKRKNGKVTITTSTISMSLTWAPAFSISAWEFPDNYPNDGLDKNPCIPRRLDVHDEGFPLLGDDPYVVHKQNRNPNTNPRNEYQGSIPAKALNYYQNTGKGLAIAQFKRDVDANITSWDE